MAQSADFTGEIKYLARAPLYQKEKPYAADFRTKDNNIPRTNHLWDRRQVKIQALTSPKDFDLNVHGFCTLKYQCSVAAGDVADCKGVETEEACFADLEDCLHRAFPEYERIESLNLTVRSRHVQFPVDEDFEPTVTTHEQPATIPHVDFSRVGIDEQIDLSFPGQLGYLQGKDYDLLTCWRPLFGPNDDWPLTLCDFTSVAQQDQVDNDDIHIDRVFENTLLHPNESHRWYYMPQQTPEDLFVFRNADSMGRRARGFHCAVENLSSQSPLRTSVEIRVIGIRP